ncbi:MAG: hypothetical protein JO270_03840 [Acidobacteriaceae bacterium]|nr:hypothetical protein [Acidobacteriaceae bacterium]
MENETRDLTSEMAAELSQVYLEIERTRALHLDVSELILSRGRVRREWIQLMDLDESKK